MASPFLRQCSRPAVKALLKQSEPRLYLEGDALYEEVRPIRDPEPLTVTLMLITKLS